MKEQLKKLLISEFFVLEKGFLIRKMQFLKYKNHKKDRKKLLNTKFNK